MRRIGRSAFFCALLAAGALAAGPAQARAPLSEAELEARRAGLMTPMGFEVGIGATIRGYIGGELALETRLTWTEQGISRELVSGPAPPDPSTIASSLGIAFEGDWIGMILERPDGVIGMLSSFGADHIANILVNTLPNQDLRLVTEITLNIPGLDEYQQQVLTEQATKAVQEAVEAAVRDATIR